MGYALPMVDAELDKQDLRKDIWISLMMPRA